MSVDTFFGLMLCQSHFKSHVGATSVRPACAREVRNGEGHARLHRWYPHLDVHLKNLVGRMSLSSFHDPSTGSQVRCEMSPLSYIQNLLLVRSNFWGPEIVGCPLLCCMSLQTSWVFAIGMVIEHPMEICSCYIGGILLNSSLYTMLSKTLTSQYTHVGSCGFFSCCVRETHLFVASGVNGEQRFHNIS
jgi:hypothetical protein